MIVLWLDEAKEDLEEIIQYIAQRNPIAAYELNQTIIKSADMLENNAFIFKRGKVNGTRELIAHPNYILIYHITPERVEILNVLHARQQYP